MQNFSSLAGLEVTEKFVIRNIIFLGGSFDSIHPQFILFVSFPVSNETFPAGVGGWLDQSGNKANLSLSLS